MGVKGPSWLSFLQHYDVVRGIAIDYMHGVLLGVQKLLLKLWFNPSFSGNAYSISHLAEALDERLQHITPTLEISRLPRSVTEHLKYWKANELRAFLFFYGAMVLRGILPDVYYKHFVLFSEAIFTLCLTNVTQSQIAHAERLLMHFVLRLENCMVSDIELRIFIPFFTWPRMLGTLVLCGPIQLFLSRVSMVKC